MVERVVLLGFLHPFIFKERFISDGSECYTRNQHIKYNKKIIIATSGVSAPRRYTFTEFLSYKTDNSIFSNLCMKKFTCGDEMQEKQFLFTTTNFTIM